MFKIPIDLDNTERQVSNFTKNEDKAKVLRDYCLVIWDECIMAGEADVNRTLGDIRQNDNRLGGIIMLFCGDFRKNLSIIPRGTKTHEIRINLKSLCLWCTVITLH